MNWFSKFTNSKKEFDTKIRTARAAEDILGNERLTSDLDDEAASILLDWGVAWAERVARSTTHLDDEAASESMYPQLKAIRKLMRLISRWGANLEIWEKEQKEDAIEKILAYRKTISDEPLPQPYHEKIMHLPEQHFENPTQLVEELSQLLGFEGGYSSSNIE